MNQRAGEPGAGERIEREWFESVEGAIRIYERYKDEKLLYDCSELQGERFFLQKNDKYQLASEILVTGSFVLLYSLEHERFQEYENRLRRLRADLRRIADEAKRSAPKERAKGLHGSIHFDRESVIYLVEAAFLGLWNDTPEDALSAYKRQPLVRWMEEREELMVRLLGIALECSFAYQESLDDSLAEQALSFIWENRDAVVNNVIASQGWPGARRHSPVWQFLQIACGGSSWHDFSSRRRGEFRDFFSRYRPRKHKLRFKLLKYAMEQGVTVRPGLMQALSSQYIEPDDPESLFKQAKAAFRTYRDACSAPVYLYTAR